MVGKFLLKEEDIFLKKKTQIAIDMITLGVGPDTLTESLKYVDVLPPCLATGQFVQTVITQVYFGLLEVNQTMRPSKTSPCPAFQTELNGEKTEMKCNLISQHVFLS